MQNVYEIDGFEPKIQLKSVLKSMECYEDSPVYEEVVEEYEEIYEEMCSLMEPVGVIGFGQLTKEIETDRYKAGTPVIFAVTSIGDGIKQKSTEAFQTGDYVKGMLCDSMADDALFSMEERLIEVLKEVCREHHVGIKKRLEAPHDISMESQLEAWKQLELKTRFGIDISTGYMFDPVKTSCQVFILTEDESMFRARHDCKNCPNLKCKRRNVPPVEVTVLKGKEKKVCFLSERESLMDGLIRSGFSFSAFCGGKGRCGKCKVQVLEGELEITAEDEKFFDREELEKGWRLSCMAYPKEDVRIAFELNDESQFEILSDYGEKKQEEETKKEAFYEIAVDIGTTTIVMELLGGESKGLIHTVSAINGQRRYGADVISRIKASMDGKKQELQESIRTDLLKGIQKLLLEAKVEAEQIRRIAIGGNTTMGHLLMGYDCDTLGVYPFTPVNISFIKGSFEEMFGSRDLNAEVVLLPGISTYVGGDITSGLYACGFDQKEEISLLVDLGTNGEMAIGNKDRILVTSTAAGPAFEGGNIAWGMGSVPGAICSVEIQEGNPIVRTIRDAHPVGICGTGVVETVSELVKEEIVDEMGLLDEDYFEDGFPLAKTEEGEEIVFTQKDVREIQLAKAAIRAGVETLLLRYGVEKEQVKNVYLAGGFGYKLDRQKAVSIGMLPEEFLDRIEAVGNSSLAGAAKYLREADGEAVLQKLAEESEEINLSADKKFNEYYMDAMMFGEE
jgi:uncharacterized 2Fe-2S/4Fe-4S cluster protein (DUF4445 family)